MTIEFPFRPEEEPDSDPGSPEEENAPAPVFGPAGAVLSSPEKHGEIVGMESPRTATSGGRVLSPEQQAQYFGWPVPPKPTHLLNGWPCVIEGPAETAGEVFVRFTNGAQHSSRVRRAWLQEVSG